MGSAPNPTGTAQGTLTKDQYLQVAQNIKNFMETNGRSPNYASTSIGSVRYEALIYAHARIINFYNTTGRLPNQVTIYQIMGKTGTLTRPKADYNYKMEGYNVQFQDKSTGNIQALAWNFGDGTTSQDRNPEHTYKPGTYNATLTVKGYGVTDSKTVTINIRRIVGNITFNLNQDKGWIIWLGQRLETFTVPLHEGVNWISIYFRDTEDESFEDGAGVLEEIGIIQDGEIIGKWHFYDPWLLEGFREGWSGDHASWKLYYDPEFKFEARQAGSVIFNRDVEVHYNNHGGFEEMISLCVATEKIKNIGGLRNWTSPFEKAAYGTFMTALTTLWLNDRLADELAPMLNVTWARNSPTVVVCGVENSGKAYVHCPDPSMGMAIQGEALNVKMARFKCSLLLSEIEHAAIGLTGLSANSTLSNIMCGILEGKVFEMIRNGTMVTIMLEDNPNSKIVIDTSTGLVWDLTESNGFWYKGAISQDSAYCYHDQLTNNLINNLISFIAQGNSILSALGSGFGGILPLTITNPEDIGKIILSRLGLRGGISVVIVWMYWEGEIILWIRNVYVPREYWRYISYHPAGPGHNCKVIARIDPNDHTIHYIEVPLEPNGYEKWDEAVHI